MQKVIAQPDKKVGILEIDQDAQVKDNTQDEPYLFSMPVLLFIHAV